LSARPTEFRHSLVMSPTRAAFSQLKRDAQNDPHPLTSNSCARRAPTSRDHRQTGPADKPTESDVLCCPRCQKPMAVIRTWPKSSGFPRISYLPMLRVPGDHDDRTRAFSFAWTPPTRFSRPPRAEALQRVSLIRLLPPRLAAAKTNPEPRHEEGRGIRDDVG
jgi:hypothetical protein